MTKIRKQSEICLIDGDNQKTVAAEIVLYTYIMLTQTYTKMAIQKRQYSETIRQPICKLCLKCFLLSRC